MKVDIDHYMIENASTTPLPIVPQSGEGDLFGALVRRKIVDTSPLYNSVSLFNLSIPKLAEDSLPPDIATIMHTTTPRLFPTTSTSITTTEFEEKQNDRKTESTASLIVQQRQLRADAIRTALTERYQQQQLQRPYFSTVSRGEFSDVLNGSTFRIGLIQQPNNHSTIIPHGVSSLISDADFVSLSFQALQGIESFLYKYSDVPLFLLRSSSSSMDQKHADLMRTKGDFVLMGRSAAAMGNYQQCFGVAFATRVLLHRAEDAIARHCQDRGLLALGAAVGDLLRIYDTSISTLHEQCMRQHILAPALLWSASALHRTMLSLLLHIVAPLDLRIALGQGQGHGQSPITSTTNTSSSSSSSSNSSSNSSSSSNNDDYRRLTTLTQYMNPDHWSSSEGITAGGWEILHDLLMSLDNVRKLASMIR